MTMNGKFRLRTRVRSKLPYFLLRVRIAAKPNKDCGRHEWYKHAEDDYRCYHCEVGRRATPGL